MFFLFVTRHACDRQTDIQTDRQKYDPQDRASIAVSRGKKWACPWVKALPQILWFHFNIYTMAEARDFTFGTQLVFANALHKTTPRGKVGLALS